jgi:hypothetical protein
MGYTIYKIMHQKGFNKNRKKGTVMCARAFYNNLIPIFCLTAMVLSILFLASFIIPQTVSAYGPYNNPTPVDIKTAKNYILFSKAGISDDTFSTFGGNLGVSPAGATSLSGIICAQISNGRMYTITAPAAPVGCITTAGTLSADNARLDQVKADFNAAYVDARSLITHPADVTIGAAAGLTGTYGRGVYAFGGAVSTGEVITFRGSSSDIWVFQITGAYTQPVAGQMQFKNESGALDGPGGPRPRNIFWAINGAVSMAANTTFAGTVLTTGAISISEGVVFNGRAFADGLISTANSDVLIVPEPPAPPARSTNYQFTEASFSSGSGFGSSSQYGAQYSVGDIGTGSAYSTSYGAYAGPISPDREYLELVTSTSLVDLGSLTTDETALGVASFYVRAYLNTSYVVVTASPPPESENGDFLNPLTGTSSPSAGTEQFGINLVENTCPAASVTPAAANCTGAFGANADLQPDATYANGEAAPGYNTADQYRYNEGDQIAQSNSAPAWGQTNFTMSYVANISPLTPAGSYSMSHSIVVITTF